MNGLVVLPVFNEAGVLPGLLERLREAVPADHLLCVDDGSTDDTPAVLAAAGVRHVRHAVNLGYEHALRTGMTCALSGDYSYVVFFDADGQHRLEDLLKVIAAFERGEAEVVVGSRYCRSLSAHGSVRSWGTRLFSRLTSRLTGVTLTDVTSGLKLIARRYLSTALALPTEDMHAELLTGLARSGARIREVPIVVEPRRAGRSMYTLWAAACYPFKTLLCLIAVLLGRQPPRPPE